MTTLKIYPDSGQGPAELHTDHGEIANILQAIGVEFEHWSTQEDLPSDAGQEAVMAAYRSAIDELNKKYGFKTIDVVGLTAEHPDKAAMRQKFLAEHTHADFEVRFFVEGRGLFYLHIGDHVYATLCEKGDLISVPANTTHWFDMGTQPYFRCIRFFTTDDGWVGNFTGSDIAGRFPDFDEYVASLS